MIKANNLTFSYGDFRVLNDVSIHCKKGKFVGIIGPNGSGKSTLLKCIYRVLEPELGTVYLNGTSLMDLSVKESAKSMSVVAQHNHSHFDFVVEDMVLMGRSPYKKTMEGYNQDDFTILDKSLNAVDMLDYKKRLFSTLSGGEMQRIILARALCQEPECLILDEPTNHLDVKHQLMMLKVVKSLDVSVVAAIHDLNIAMNYCDYVYVMSQGKVKYHGPPQDIINDAVIADIFDVKAKVIKQDGETAIVFKEVVS
ncbi:ABC transporter ATP-binding protein [Acidaminobacter sp. JC074]|uniref:ABC transporter ATP-binding protein n=1 Tax=Acidaminobacter sp. JC074 TaxID=2530199 RepID=UPI001F111555|nr:ABC transporter ATP-binding protein [Acidaminobacter sp. JC074]MCH4886551.1 ABC transporter ATP-binding protein [Acidaminobacter sp. JC074]